MFVEIDGSYKEGGGQILRTALALSCITGNAFHIYNIRKGRKNPGLQQQHLLGIGAVSRLYNSDIQGAYLHSEEIWFSPREIKNKEIYVTIPTAGSIPLILQSFILPASRYREPIKIIFNGGATDTHFAPTINYYLYVLLPMIKNLGYEVEINILRRGFYPRGGAKLEAIIYPAKIKDEFVLVEPGGLEKILAISTASKFLRNRRVAERQLDGAEKILNKYQIEKHIEYVDSVCPGCVIDIFAKFSNSILGANAIGAIGKKAEDVGKEAAEILLEDINSGGAIDRFMADQILTYAVLSNKVKIKVAKITNHTITNIWTIQKFINKSFNIQNNFIYIE